MKKIGSTFLAIILVMSLMICPVMAKNSHSSSGGGKGTSVSSNNGNSDSKVKTNDSTQKNADKHVDLTNGKKQEVQQRIQSKKDSTEQKQFNDTKGHWAENSIVKVQKLGLINGYQDGSFNPDQEVTQIEAMVMIVNTAELLGSDPLTEGTSEPGDTVEDPAEEETTIEDDGTAVETDENDEDEGDTGDIPAWARNQARKASLAGIININRFHSAVQASRAQVAVELAKALGLTPEPVDANAFTDSLLISPEDAGYIIALKNAGVISGTPDGKFNPNSSVTRAEMATMLANILAAAEEETTDPGTADPGTTDPGTADPGTADPGTADPGTADPGTTDPGTADPSTTDPGTADPGTTDPGTADPGTADPGTADPGTV